MEEEKEVVVVEACIRGKGAERGPAAGSDCGVCKKSQLKASSPTAVVKESCHISSHQDLMWQVPTVQLIMFSFAYKKLQQISYSN